MIVHHSHQDKAKHAEEFFKMISSKKFFPNSPTFTGAGTPLGQLAACFVLAIDDDMGKDSPEGIFSTLRNAALIQQTGGGIGFSFSRLRPKNAIVRSSMGRASGPVSFMQVYDCAFGAIAQGGTRRGASMAVLRVDHPDIDEFITCKTKEGTITNFNISVGITDKFMECVRSGAPFELIDPTDKHVVKTVDARELFDRIVTAAHHNGEPGVLFLDAANRANPVGHLYTLESTNPCGEQFLGPYENCCLGSINLATHVRDGAVDWKELEHTARAATRFLDDVIDENKYVPAVPQLKEAAQRVRRIGLGIMGLSDVFYQLGVRYGSDESLALASELMEFVRYTAMDESANLAAERGPFPAIKGSIYDKDNFRFTVPTAHPFIPPAVLAAAAKRYGRPTVDWTCLVEKIKKHGIRNGAQTTIAPTGTIGTVIGCEGYGCEPVFALAYQRRVRDSNPENKDFFLTYWSPALKQGLDKLTSLNEESRKAVEAHILRTGSCKGLEGLLPKEFIDTFVVSSDVTAKEHVKVQATLQRFVDNSISKTINFPPGATVDEVKEAYQFAWESGCKGLTIYVTGSRSNVVLTTAETAEKEKKKEEAKPAAEKEEDIDIVSDEKKEVAVALSEDESQELSLSDEPTTPQVKTTVAGTTVTATIPLSSSLAGFEKQERPLALKGTTYRTVTPLGNAYVTINEYNNEPFEIFLTIGKGGSDIAAISEALGRLFSLLLRTPSPMSPLERLKEIAKQLNGIGGSHSRGFGKARVRSLPDAIAKLIRQYLEGKREEALRTAAQQTTDDELCNSGASSQQQAARPATPELPTQPIMTSEHQSAPPTISLSATSFAIGDICPECGNGTLLNIEGCKKCQSCGYSEC